MSSVAQDVSAYMDKDVVLSEAIARGIVNLRALSRWLIRTQGWEASETAVLSALRRRSAATLVDCFTSAREILSNGKLHSRAGICLVKLPRNRMAQDRLATLCKSLDYSKSETMRVIECEAAIFVVIDDENMARAEQILGTDLIVEVMGGVTALGIITPEGSERTPGILSLLSTTMALHGINIVHCATALRENVFLVADADALRAYQALTSLIGKDGGARPPPMVNLTSAQRRLPSGLAGAATHRFPPAAGATGMVAKR